MTDESNLDDDGACNHGHDSRNRCVDCVREDLDRERARTMKLGEDTETK